MLGRFFVEDVDFDIEFGDFGFDLLMVVELCNCFKIVIGLMLLFIVIFDYFIFIVVVEYVV